MKTTKTQTPDNILNIFDKNFLQHIQNFFSKTLGIALITVYQTQRLTESSNTNDFCTNYTKKSTLGCKLCAKCHAEWEKMAMEQKKPIVCKCHAGLTNFTIPIIVENKYLASIIGGQLLTSLFDETHFRNLANKLEIEDIENYIIESKSLKIVTEEQVKAIAELLYTVMNSITSIIYANEQLKDLGLEYKVQRKISLEELFYNDYVGNKRQLSAREYEILKLLVKGKNNSEIANELFISSHTVKAHVSSIIEKFAVEDRVQVAVKAVREGFI